jgi:formylglycine-generating enzyme required for sulfatase activity
MQDFVAVETARTYTGAFYRQLLQHGIIDLASNQARQAVKSEKLPGSSIPVLFMRLPDGQLLAPAIKREPFEPETVYIPAGKFWIGCDPDETGSRKYEQPRHQVYLPAYRIGKYPVTNEQYERFVKEKNYPAPKIGWQGQRPAKEMAHHPVQGISWIDAQEFCKWLSKKTGRPYRLPSEAEWEKAARGKNGAGPYPWGAWEEGRCNFGTNATTPIDAFFAQNDYSCFDLVGNVPEWTNSLWGKGGTPDEEFYYPWDPDLRRDDVTAESQIYRVYRGGSFADRQQTRLRCASRRGEAPTSTGEFERQLGFRVVLDISKGATQ